MTMKIEHEGKEIVVWTQDEVDAEIKGLKVTNENLKAEKKELSDKVAEAKETTRVLEEAKAKAEGDNETLRRIADEREAEKRQAVDDERKKFSDLLNMTKKEKIDNFLTGLIDEAKPADTISAKHLRKLLKSDYEFDFDIDKSQFKVTGEGVTSVDDLKRILREGDEYKRYLAGSGATGGGATGGRSSGAGAGKWADYTPEQLSKIRQENPAQYEQLKQTR